MKGYIVIHKGTIRYFSYDNGKLFDYSLDDDYTIIDLYREKPFILRNGEWVAMEDSAEI